VQDIDLNEFSEHMNSESDRACAILGAALLDAKLEELFKRKLRRFQNDLLKSMCPLGTFSSRIRLARAIDWISEDVQCDLDTIRGIRNDFAHSFDYKLSFANQSIAARCKNLRTAQAFLDGLDIAAAKPNQNISVKVIQNVQATFDLARWRFQLVVDFVSQYLDDINGNLEQYSGPNLTEQVRDLSSNFRITISATAVVGHPPTSPEVEC